MNLSQIFYRFIFLIVFIILCLYFLHPIPLQGPNVDLGHHLLLGKTIVDTGKVPDINLFSYTYPNYQFVNSQWLSEVIYYLWYSLFNYNGLILLGLFLITTAFYFVLTAENFKNSLFPVLITALIYLQIIIDRTEIKPELFSLLLLSLFLYILYRYREKHTKLIYLLPALELLWVNFHIYFFVGSVVVTLFLVDAFVARKDKLKSKRLLTLFAVTLSTNFVTIFNPNFIKGATYPLFVLGNYGYQVIENLNFFAAYKLYPDITFIYFIVSAFLLWVGLVVFRKKIKPVGILLSAFFTFMGFFAVRDFPLFAFGTFIPLTNVIALTIESISKRNGVRNIQVIKIAILVLVCVVVLPTVKWSIDLHGLGLGVTDNAYAAINFFKQNDLKGPIYNNYNIGNYLEYFLYPGERVFVDGNPEEYPKEFFESVYYPAENSYTIFEQISKKYNFNVIFYEHKNQTQNINQLLNKLVQSDQWKMVYLNSSIIIFVRNSSENQKVIKKYYINQDNLNINNLDMSDKSKIGDLSNFFMVVGWYKLMYEMDLKYLSLDPNNCTALRHVTVIMAQLNHPLKSVYASKYQNLCQ